MGALSPGDPFGTLVPLLLHLDNFLHELVVDVPVFAITEGLGDDDDVVVLDKAVDLLLFAVADDDPEVGPSEGRGGVETVDTERNVERF